MEKTIEEVKHAEQPCYGNHQRFTTIAYILNIHTMNCIYKGCPDCNTKKLVVLGDGQYICQRCKKDNYKYYYQFEMDIGDSTGNVRVKVFNAAAEKFLGENGDHLSKLQEKDGLEFLDLFKQHVNKLYRFELKKMWKTNGNDEIFAEWITKPDYKQRCCELIRQLERDL